MRIEVISMDIPASEAMRRNAGRERPLPERAYIDLMRKRDPVISDEAHGLTSIDMHGCAQRIFGRPEFSPVSVLRPSDTAASMDPS